MVNPINKILGKAHKDTYSHNLTKQGIYNVHKEIVEDSWMPPENKNWNYSIRTAQIVHGVAVTGSRPGFFGRKGNMYPDKVSKNNIRNETLKCNFCGGKLGAVRTQHHENEYFTDYRVCSKCGYQWSKQYWPWLKEQQEK